VVPTGWRLRKLDIPASGGCTPEIEPLRVRRTALRARARMLATHEARRLLLPLAALTLLSTAGTAAAPTLAHDQPLVLMALSPRLAFLTLAANNTSFVPFLAVGLVRLCLADPFHFALGRRHGTNALDRLARFTLIRRIRDLTRHGVPLLVFFRPNGTYLAIAGASPTNRLHVAVADVAGTLAYLLLIRLAGTALL
jgi:hypothetical protein